MAKKSNGGLIKFLSFLLIVTLLGGAIALIYYFTNGGNEEFKTFYMIDRDGEAIFASKSKAEFHVGQTYAYSVKYTFDFDSSDEPREYHVEIVPNAEKDFDFKVDGKGKKWSSEENFNEFFNLKKEASSFTFEVSQTATNVADLLAERYEGKTVEVSKTVERPYILRVSNYNEEITYEIAFSALPAITKIELGRESIVFNAPKVSTSNPTPEAPSDPTPEAPSVSGYAIKYDTLGSGSIKNITFQCQSSAVSGETVSFTVSVSGFYNITRVVLQDGYGEDIQRLSPVDGTYTFTMPDNPADGYVTVMFYLEDYSSGADGGAGGGGGSGI